MSLEDPFFVVKEEVEKAVSTANRLYTRWCELADDPSSVSREEYGWTTNELRNSVRSIEWDLEDLEETIGIVERNPKKFKIEDQELLERRHFIDTTKRKIKELKDHLSNPSRKISSENGSARQNLVGARNGPSRPMDRYARLDNELENSNQRFIDDCSQQQQLIVQSHDDQLEQIGSSVGVLKNMSHHIGSELNEQNVMLDDFRHDMDSSESRLDSVMKKMSKVLHMSNDKRQWIAIVVLLVVLVIVIILLFV